MMNVHVFCVVLVISLVRGQDFQCPEAGGQCIVGSFPDPTWCAYYYSCFPHPLGGCEQQRIMCTPGWIFDWDDRHCVNDLTARCDVPATSMIYATRSSTSSSAGMVQFEGGNENLVGTMWDNETHTFHMKAATGIYFFALHGAARTSSSLDYNLMSYQAPVVGAGRRFGVSGTGDIISRDIALTVNSGTSYHIQSSTGVYSSQYLDTGLAIFSLTETLSGPHELVAFSVARDAFLIGDSDPVPYNIEFYNAGEHYNIINHRFTAPSAGIYYFSISTGLFSGMAVHMQMHVNEEPYIDLNRRSTAHTGEDIISRGIMMLLSENDEVHMVNELNEASYSSVLMEMSFSGFKYEPAIDTSSIAWSVARTTSVIGNIAPVPFDTILVNQGGPWQAGNHSVLVPEGGVYFIHLSVGLMGGRSVTYGLMRNNQYEVFAARRSVNHNNQDLAARSALRRYSTSDSLAIGTNGIGGIYSDARMQTTFIGFLLYSDE